jgi:hypothetical protein
LADNEESHPVIHEHYLLYMTVIKLGKQNKLCSLLKTIYTQHRRYLEEIFTEEKKMNGVTVLLLCCVVRVTHQLQWQLLAADNKSKFVTRC